MKNILKVLKGILIGGYLIIAVFIIVCLLNRNENGVIELGSHNLIIVSSESDELESNYNKGDLIVVKNISKDDVEINDMVFFYRMEFSEGSVNLANVIKKEVVNENETTFTVKDNYRFSSEFLIGRSSDSTTYGTVGSIINLLVSRWGFLFLIILPLLFAFLYQIYNIVVEVKKEMNEEE